MTRLHLPELGHACYALSGSVDEWLEGIVRVLTPLMDSGLGIAAWPFRVGSWADETLPVGVDPEIGRVMREVGAAAPESVARSFFLGPRAKSACERIHSRVGLDEHAAFGAFKRVGIRDFRSLTVLDASGEGLAFAAPERRVIKSTRASTDRLERVGAHVLSGFRLRCALAQVDAVLQPDGKLLDASHPEAQAPAQREALRNAVKALDRAFCTRAGAETDDALEGWQALVSGRWSLVESFDSDGRRYLVAHRNPPGSAAVAAISPLEAQALILRAQSASYKLVAYELGVSAAAAHQFVRSGMKKLGVKNETELAPLFQTAAPPGVADEGQDR